MFKAALFIITVTSKQLKCPSVGEWINESDSRSVVSHSLRPQGLYSPRNLLGQHTGVGSLSPSRGSSQPRDQTQVFRIAGRCFKLCVTREAIRNLKFSFKGIHTHIPPKIWRHTLPHQCSFSVCTLKHGPEMGVFQSQLNQGKWLLYLSDLLS